MYQIVQGILQGREVRFVRPIRKAPLVLMALLVPLDPEVLEVLPAQYLQVNQEGQMDLICLVLLEVPTIQEVPWALSLQLRLVQPDRHS